MVKARLVFDEDLVCLDVPGPQIKASQRCFVLSRNALSPLLERDRVSWRYENIGMLRMQELFLSDGWVEVGQFV